MEAGIMADEEEVDVPVIRINAANLLDIEGRRNELLKDEMETEKMGQEILTTFKSNGNRQLLPLVALACFISKPPVLSLEANRTVLVVLMVFVLAFGVQLWIFTSLAKMRLATLITRKKWLITHQRYLARGAERELARLGDENLGEGGPVIVLTSFLARPQSTNALEEIYQQINSFVWTKVFQCFLLLLLISLVQLTENKFLGVLPTYASSR